MMVEKESIWSKLKTKRIETKFNIVPPALNYYDLHHPKSAPKPKLPAYIAHQNPLP